MHPLSAAVEQYLLTQSHVRALHLAAWFSGFPTDVQEILLEKARGGRAVALVFGAETRSLGEIAA